MLAQHQQENVSMDAKSREMLVEADNYVRNVDAAISVLRSMAVSECFDDKMGNALNFVIDGLENEIVGLRMLVDAEKKKARSNT